jgi:hypothetical protein
MSRVVTFGCSHTYGLELPDCLTVDDPPSKMGFSNIVGNALNLEVINRADTGASQKQIAATVLETEFDIGDIVIINWSSPLRRGIWNGSHWEQLASWTEDRIWKRYYAKYHRIEDDTLDSLMNINLANLFLKNKCKKVINAMHRHSNEIVNSTHSWNSVSIDLIFADDNFYYKQLKYGHPDLKSHKVFAERLLNLL